MPKKIFLIAAFLLAALPLADLRAQMMAARAASGQNVANNEGTPAATPANAALFPAEDDDGSATAASPAASGAQTGAQQRGGRRRNGGGRGGRSAHAADAATQQADADPLEVRVAFRRAKTVALARDPGLQDLLAQADNARTDEIKRSYLRAYYTRLYASVLKIQPTPAMKAHVALLSQASEQRYDPKRRALSGDDDLTEGGGGGHGGGKRRR